MFPGYPPSHVPWLPPLRTLYGAGTRPDHILPHPNPGPDHRCAFRTVYGAGKLVKSSFEGEKVRGT